MFDESPVDEFLASYDDEIHNLASQVRALILDVLPDTIEQLDVPAKIVAYGYDRTYTGMICAIAPQKSYINLMFAKGTELPDPDSLLVGTGKKARHIKIETSEIVHDPAVRTLLEDAAVATKQGMKKK